MTLHSFSRSHGFKFLSSLVALIFCVTQTVWGSAPDSISVAFQSNHPSANLEQFVKVSDFFVPGLKKVQMETALRNPSQKLIVFFEEAHSNVQALKNIAESLRLLAPKSGLSHPWIALEGTAPGEIDHRVLSAFPDKFVRTRVADYFLKSGEIDGADYFAAVHNRKARLFGVDDPALVEQNRASYRFYLSIRDEAERALARLEKAVETLKQKNYRPDMMGLDQSTRKFERGGSYFSKHLSFLKEMARKLALDLSPYQAFRQFFELKSLEEQITAPVLARAIQAFAAESGETLTEERILDLWQKDASLPEKYPVLAQRGRMLELLESLDSQNLFKEIRTLTAELWAKMLAYPEARDTFAADKTLQFYKHLFSFELAPEQYREALASADYSLEFLKKKISDNQFMLSRSLRPREKDFSILAQAERQPRQFYALAEKRNRALASNLLQLAEKNLEAKTFFISGGFHREEITKIFKDKGIAFAVLSPKIEELTDDSIYWKRLAGYKVDDDYEEALAKFSTVKNIDLLTEPSFRGKAVTLTLAAARVLPPGQRTSALARYGRRLADTDRRLLAQAQAASLGTTGIMAVDMTQVEALLASQKVEPASFASAEMPLFPKDAGEVSERSVRTLISELVATANKAGAGLNPDYQQILLEDAHTQTLFGLDSVARDSGIIERLKRLKSAGTNFRIVFEPQGQQVPEQDLVAPGTSDSGIPRQSKDAFFLISQDMTDTGVKLFINAKAFRSIPNEYARNALFAFFLLDFMIAGFRPGTHDLDKPARFFSSLQRLFQTAERIIESKDVAKIPYLGNAATEWLDHVMVRRSALDHYNFFPQLLLDAEHDFRPGTIVKIQGGEYKILERLIRGGMGITWRALNLANEAEVVIKQLRPDNLRNEAMRRRFGREIDALIRNHGNPHVAKLIAHNRPDSAGGSGWLLNPKDPQYVHPSYVMELAPGIRLDTYLAQLKAEDAVRTSWPRAKNIMIQILQALVQIHKNHTLHRDLTPSNINIDSQDRDFVRIFDFGLARHERDEDDIDTPVEETMTHTGLAIGTLRYMSPEQARGEREKMGFRSDIYSAGAILYFLLTGDTLFPSADRLRVVLDQQANRHVDLSSQGLDPVITGIIQKAIAEDPDDRYATAHDFLEALEAWEPGQADTAVNIEAAKGTSIIPASQIETRLVEREGRPVTRPSRTRKPLWLIPAAGLSALGLILAKTLLPKQTANSGVKPATPSGKTVQPPAKGISRPGQSQPEGPLKEVTVWNGQPDFGGALFFDKGKRIADPNHVVQNVNGKPALSNKTVGQFIVFPQQIDFSPGRSLEISADITLPADPQRERSIVLGVYNATTKKTGPLYVFSQHAGAVLPIRSMDALFVTGEKNDYPVQHGAWSTVAKSVAPLPANREFKVRLERTKQDDYYHLYVDGKEVHKFSSGPADYGTLQLVVAVNVGSIPQDSKLLPRVTNIRLKAGENTFVNKGPSQGKQSSLPNPFGKTARVSRFTPAQAASLGDGIMVVNMNQVREFLQKQGLQAESLFKQVTINPFPAPEQINYDVLKRQVVIEIVQAANDAGLGLSVSHQRTLLDQIFHSAELKFQLEKRLKEYPTGDFKLIFEPYGGKVSDEAQQDSYLIGVKLDDTEGRFTFNTAAFRSLADDYHRNTLFAFFFYRILLSGVSQNPEEINEVSSTFYSILNQLEAASKPGRAFAKATKRGKAAVPQPGTITVSQWLGVVLEKNRRPQGLDHIVEELLEEGEHGLAPGKLTRDGRFRIISRLGRGGMGIAWEALEVESNKKVVIKQLPRSSISDRVLRGRFYREARLLQQIQTNPYVAKYLAGNLPNLDEFQSLTFNADAPQYRQVYYVMEWAPGTELREWVAEMGKDTKTPVVQKWSRSKAVMHQLLSSLIQVHEQGIIHRDLSPGNIKIEKEHDDFVRIFDFGLARYLPTGVRDDDDLDEVIDKTLTEEKAFIGTPGFTSPEQARGEKNLDQTTDIYAAGLILFLLLTGQRPFEGETAVEIITRQQQNKHAGIEKFGLDPVIVDILKKALADKPRDRYQSALEFRNALDGWTPPQDAHFHIQPQELISAPGEPSQLKTVDFVDPGQTTIIKKPRLSPWKIVLAMLVAVGLIIGIVWSWPNKKPVESEPKEPPVPVKPDDIKKGPKVTDKGQGDAGPMKEVKVWNGQPDFGGAEFFNNGVKELAPNHEIWNLDGNPSIGNTDVGRFMVFEQTINIRKGAAGQMEISGEILIPEDPQKQRSILIGLYNSETKKIGPSYVFSQLTGKVHSIRTLPGGFIDGGKNDYDRSNGAYGNTGSQLDASIPRGRWVSFQLTRSAAKDDYFHLMLDGQEVHKISGGAADLGPMRLVVAVNVHPPHAPKNEPEKRLTPQIRNIQIKASGNILEAKSMGAEQKQRTTSEKIYNAAQTQGKHGVVVLQYSPAAMEKLLEQARALPIRNAKIILLARNQEEFDAAKLRFNDRVANHNVGILRYHKPVSELNDATDRHNIMSRVAGLFGVPATDLGRLVLLGDEEFAAPGTLSKESLASQETVRMLVDRKSFIDQMDYRTSYLLTAVALSKQYEFPFGLQFNKDGTISLTASLLADFQQNIQAMLLLAHAA